MKNNRIRSTCWRLLTGWLAAVPTGKDLVIQSENGPAACIIDCQNSARAFYIHSGETSAFRLEGISGSSTDTIHCMVPGYTAGNTPAR